MNTGEDNVLEMYSDGLRIMTQLIINLHESGEWPMHFTGYNHCLKEAANSHQSSDHRTISLTAHTAKRAVRILRRRIENKSQNIIGEDQFGFRRRTGT
jgi:hypothetical protein